MIGKEAEVGGLPDCSTSFSIDAGGVGYRWGNRVVSGEVVNYEL